MSNTSMNTEYGFHRKTDGELQNLREFLNDTPGIGNDLSNGRVTSTGSTTTRTLADRFADNVNVLDFGADETGVSDSTAAFREAMQTGSTVYVPDGTYTISSIPEVTQCYLVGSHQTNVEIITTGASAFPNVNIGNVKGIRFSADVADTKNLFDNPTKVSGYFQDCYFKDYNYVFYFPTNGDSLRVHECYFRDGNYGIYANVAHNVHVTNCIFWQQKQRSIALFRGTGSSVRNCNFIGTNDRSASVFFFSQQCLFESNYMEFYGTGGNIQNHWIQAEVNDFAFIPVIRNNLINGDNEVEYGVRYTYTGSTSNSNTLSNYENHYEAFTIRDIYIPQLDSYESLDVHSNSSNNTPINFPEGRYYTSEVNNIDTSTGNNVVIPIDSGTVFDPYLLTNGDNTLNAYKSGKRFRIQVNGSYTASSANNGIVIKVRDVNGTELKQLNISSPYSGEVPIPASFILDSAENNTSYRVDWDALVGASRPDTMDVLVTLTELPN